MSADRDPFETTSGIPLAPVYDAADLAARERVVGVAAHLRR